MSPIPLPPDRTRRLALLLGATACALLAWVGSVAACEGLASWAESRPNVYLWWWDEWMQVFTPSTYVERGAGRVQLCGASEMREGVLVDQLDRALPGHEVLQDAFSLGTLQSARLLLEHQEREHGPASMPEVLLLGLTPRFCLQHPPTPDVPSIRALQTYAPGARVVFEEGEPPRLERRPLWESLRARYRLLVAQSPRYRNALLAASLSMTREVHASEGLGRDSRLRPPKWHRQEPLDHSRYPEAVAVARRQWDYDLADKDIEYELRAIRSLCERHGTRLLLVQMPRASWMRACDPEGFHAHYRALVANALPGVPSLDLERLLEDEEYFDWAHATAQGAARVTEELARYVGEHLE